MQFAALLQLNVPGPVPPAGLRLTGRLLRRLQREPGLRAVRVFRGITVTEAVFFLGEWSDAQSAATAGKLPDWAALPARAEAVGIGWGGLTPLAPGFERSLGEEQPAASLLRVGQHAPTAAAPIAALNRERSLRALAAPGSWRAAGAGAPSVGLSVCRIDFNSEDALWAYLDSPQKADWTRLAAELGEREIWALDLPRLAVVLPPPAEPALTHHEPSVADGPLNVTVERADPPGAARLVCQGRLQEHGARRCAALMLALADQGHERVELDLSGLSQVEPPALALLTGCVAELRQRGVTFGIRDDGKRLRRVTRQTELRGGKP